MVGISIGALAAAGLLLWRFGGEPRPAAVSAAAPASTEPAPPAPARAAKADGRVVTEREEPERDPSEGVFDASAVAWSKVDMDAVRAALPDNSYWERSMPTRDPEVLRAREEERAHWEAQYGKVLSSTASEAEVRDYYAHRQRIATDAVEFSSYLLDHYADVLPERDVGLLQLARRLNLARLEQLPRQLRDALERREAHEQARRDWLAQQELFEGAGTPPTTEAD